MKKAQKKLIALAVASLTSAPLWAQSSSIQLYGVADAFVKYGRVDGG